MGKSKNAAVLKIINLLLLLETYSYLAMFQNSWNSFFPPAKRWGKSKNAAVLKIIN
ncbi:MAG: hypothetical protein LBR79_00845 [Oscillospiraceae bacterium]|nr:hypothetical protein [Oscillospiraceae bacterium]